MSQGPRYGGMFTEMATVVLAIANMKNWRTTLLYIFVSWCLCVGGRMEGELWLGVGVPVCICIHS